MVAVGGIGAGDNGLINAVLWANFNQTLSPISNFGRDWAGFRVWLVLVLAMVLDHSGGEVTAQTISSFLFLTKKLTCLISAK